HTAVVIWGGGTQIRLGSLPRRYDVAFSTERMTRVLEYEPADLTCGVQAGMRLADLQAILGKQGQRLPFDPPYPKRATVGGMLAANSSGLSRSRYGTVRDWLIGVAVAYPSGKVVRAGGKVVKNVEGYSREVEAARDLAVKTIRDAGGRVEGQDIPVSFWDAARDWSAPADESALLRAIVPLAQMGSLADALPSDGQVMVQPAAGILE